MLRGHFRKPSTVEKKFDPNPHRIYAFKNSMNSRERVLSALEHKEPDKVPVDFGAHRSSGIAALAYNRLRDYLGLPYKPAKVYDVIQQMAVIEDDVLDILGPFDAVEMGRPYCLDDANWKEWTLPDGSECLIPNHIQMKKKGDNWTMLTPSGKDGGVMTKGMIYVDQTLFPWGDEDSEDFDKVQDALSDIIWSNPTPPFLKETDYQSLSKRIREFQVTNRQGNSRAVWWKFFRNFPVPVPS